MEKLKHLLIEQQTKCPIATQDIDVNLKNRKKAINEYMYGPLDPNQPNEEYWKAISAEWNMYDAKQAKSARCGNCAAFDITDEMLACIAKGIGFLNRVVMQRILLTQEHWVIVNS
jgi:hypothetical protein